MASQGVMEKYLQSVKSAASSAVSGNASVNASGTNSGTNSGNAGNAGKSVFVLLIVAAMFVLVFVILYIVSMVRKNKLQNVVLQDKIITLDSAIIPFKISNSALSLTNNGQEYSFSFWLYIGDQYTPSSQHKLLFQRGNVSDVPNEYSSKTNPIVFMDKNTNKMYIAISTSNVNGNMTLDSILEKSPNGRYTSGYMVGFIDYVPLQRWVNVTFFIKDDKLFIFLDGDMYTAVSVSDMQIASSSGPSKLLSQTKRPVIKDTDGSATIGNKSYPIPGFISYTRFFNYALTQKEIQSVYQAGPTKRSMLALIGLNTYGLRTPVYNLDDDAKKSS
jgi:hypothetical protein